jgi:hypothetical protein
MDAIERLLAIEEIRWLKARYFRFVDGKDWAGLETVFAPDIVCDRTYGNSVQNARTGEWEPPVPPDPLLVCGRPEVIGMVQRAVAGLLTVHHGHMPEISVADEDNASGIWAMSDELSDREGRLIVCGRGHYHDTYRRTEEGWRIATSKLTRLSLVRGDGKKP